MVLFRLCFVIACALVVGAACPARAEPSEAELSRQFSEQVAPFLKTYCHACHGSEKPEAEFDLTKYNSLAHVAQDYPTWDIVLDRLLAGEMPPADAEAQPSKSAVEAVTD